MKSKKKRKVLWINKIFDYRLLFYDFVKITGAIPTLIYLRIKRIYLNGKKPKGLFSKSSIIVSNHISYIDPVIISNAFWTRRICFIATDYFFEKRFRKLLFSGFGCIPVSIENVAVSTFKKAENVIRRGHCIGMFPEGGVERGDEINKFKAGAIMLAILTKAPIIPVYIEKRSKWYKRQRVVIGEKINFNDMFTTPYPNMDEIQKAVNKLQNIEYELERISKLRKEK